MVKEEWDTGRKAGLAVGITAGTILAIFGLIVIGLGEVIALIFLGILGLCVFAGISYIVYELIGAVIATRR